MLSLHGGSITPLCQMSHLACHIPHVTRYAAHAASGQNGAGQGGTTDFARHLPTVPTTHCPATHCPTAAQQHYPPRVGMCSTTRPRADMSHVACRMSHVTCLSLHAPCQVQARRGRV